MPSLNLRIICINPPPTSTEVLFGLQDKKGELHPGEPQADGTLRFTCEIPVTRKTGSEPPNFGGSFAHGTPQQRFLYLTYRTIDGNLIKRLKAQLKNITWQQIEAAQGRALEATLDGNQSGSGALISGWTPKK